MNKVSIVLPTFNRAKYLRESLDSCLNQTYSNIELIVVDGGSTDGTLDILESYTDSRVILLHQEANEGKLPGALNIGFARTSGEYLTWMQDDCYYAPEAIETMVRFLDDHPEVDFVYADYWDIDEQGRIIQKVRVGPTETLMEKNNIGVCHLYRRTVYEAVGNYDVNSFLAEDYEYWLRVAQKFKMEPHHESLYYYRMHPEALTSVNYTNYRRLRIGASFKRKLYGLPWSKYRKAMAEAYIGEAFASYEQGDFRNLKPKMLAGFLYDPVWLQNRGALSILFESIVGPKVVNVWRNLKGS